MTKHDAIQLIDLPEDTSLFNVNPDQITEGLKQNPWVSGVDVQRQFPHTLIITPTERKVIAIAYISSDILHGRSGTMTHGLHRCLPRSMLTTRAMSSQRGRVPTP